MTRSVKIGLFCTKKRLDVLICVELQMKHKFDLKRGI